MAPCGRTIIIFHLLLNETSIDLLLNVAPLLALRSDAVGAASPSPARIASSTTDKFSTAEHRARERDWTPQIYCSERLATLTAEENGSSAVYIRTSARSVGSAFFATHSRIERIQKSPLLDLFTSTQKDTIQLSS